MTREIQTLKSAVTHRDISGRGQKPCAKNWQYTNVAEQSIHIQLPSDKKKLKQISIRTQISIHTQNKHTASVKNRI